MKQVFAGQGDDLQVGEALERGAGAPPPELGLVSPIGADEDLLCIGIREIGIR